MLKRRVLPLTAVVVFIVAVLVSVRASATPPVSWQPEPFDIAVPPSGRLATKVTAKVSRDIPATRVEVTPSLASYVTSIEPATLPALTAGSEVTINLIFEVATGTPKGTYDGTIHLRQMSGRGNGTQARPLSMVLTVGDLLYPPDPGEAGKATLEGIDSDGDGLRDDIQRYIEVTYPGDVNIRRALRQSALIRSQTLRDAASESAAVEHFKESGRADECLRFLKGYKEAARIAEDLDVEFLNTRERSLAYIQFDSQLGNHVFEFPAQDKVTTCNFSVESVGGAQ